MIGEVGEHDPSIDVRILERLLNIKMKRLFNTVNLAGACLVEHGPSIEVNVLEKLLNNKGNDF